jgi:hypothetical protein
VIIPIWIAIVPGSSPPTFCPTVEMLIPVYRESSAWDARLVLTVLDKSQIGRIDERHQFTSPIDANDSSHYLHSV